MLFNPELLAAARMRLASIYQDAEKAAFAPPGMDPSAGGGMPPGAPPGMPPGMDPSMMGGMPPPGMDPSAGGMPPGPPMDPSMMAGAPPPGIDPEMIRQLVQQELAKGNGAAGAGMPGKPGKPDLNAVAMDLYQTKKLVVMMAQQMGLTLPQDVLDGPNRDPSTGAAMPPGTPGSTSDASKPVQPGPGPSAGPDNALQPLSPLQPASLTPPPDAGTKAGSDMVPDIGISHPARSSGFDIQTVNRAAALSAILHSIRSNRNSQR